MQQDQRYRLFVFIFICSAFQKADSECSESANWMREKTLDAEGNMIIKWNFTSERFTMMMIGRTKGYISVGFSGTNSMKGADIVVGWVENNQSYLQDRYSSNGEEPVLDKDQSLSLLGGMENNTHTSLCFERKLNTCDEEDIVIERGAVYVLWAIGASDPDNKNGSLQYLSANRDITLLYFLAIAYTKPISTDIEYFYISPRKNVSVKSRPDRTLYWCTNYKYPPFKNKRYIIGYEILIPAMSKHVVHHAVLSLCESKAAAEIYDKMDPNGYECQTSQSSKYRNPCNTEVAVWAKGIEQIYFPEKIGIPFGSETEDFYLKTEIHYAIPKDMQALEDNTTIRLLLTKRRPQFEASILNTGLEISPIHLIPPKQKSFSTPAICGGSCLQQTFPEEGFINVVAFRFHAHLSARKMRLHIFRNNSKFLTLSDEHFNFSFQGFQFLEEEIKIFSTDLLVSECVYDTSERTATTIGASPTEQEMCNPDVLYYPRIGLSWCMSFPNKQGIFNLTGIEEITNSTQTSDCEDESCLTIDYYPGIAAKDVITKPSQFANQTLEDHMKKFNDWTPEKIKELESIYLQPHTPVCLGDFQTNSIKNKVPLEFPAKSFQSPNPCTT